MIVGLIPVGIGAQTLFFGFVIDKCFEAQTAFGVNEIQKDGDGMRRARELMDKYCVEVVGEDGKVRLEAK